MISYDEGFKEGEVACCGSVPHRGVQNRGGKAEIQEHHVKYYAFQYLMVKLELVDDVTELSFKVSCKRPIRLVHRTPYDKEQNIISYEQVFLANSKQLRDFTVLLPEEDD
ncbi:hypothetical protein POTOM_013455 [Populus tomentosa]|uniref:Uncharacterized protein n=1 Tax=Populus tomentosa TaxID=118781 RepID=A0A8X8D9D8_POPTO|nr:hypothetical protein POTOM_013455 [Populus tomentosa]